MNVDVQMNLYPVTVINDFYDNPDEIRKYALAQKYTYCHEIKDIDYVFPGSRTKDLKELSRSLYEKICKRLISAFHIPEHDVMRWQISTSFQIVEAEYGSGLIHQDQNTVFAGVLYLTPNAPLDSGTSLFRKNAKFDQAIYEKLIRENDEHFKNKEPIDFTYHQMFDEVIRVNNVYNTLILFEGDIHHCANNFFGDTKHDARLAQVFFINRVDANKESSFPLRRMKRNAI
jgi:hypothetical protein